MTAGTAPTDLLPGAGTPAVAESVAALRAAVAGRWSLDGSLAPFAGTGRTVVTVADGAYAPAARRYAAATGADLVETDMATLAGGKALPRGGTVVVVAEPHLLTFDLVETVAERALGRPGLRVGYLTAHDAGALDLVLGKAARTLERRGARGPGGRAWLDVFRGDNGREGAAGTEHGLAGPAVLAGDYRSLVVGGHGDGLHVRLPDVTICGLVGDAETAGGRRVAGGCRRGARPYCKKRTAAVVPASDIRADLLVVLSCKSFVATRQVYPSDTSVLLSAAAGHPGAVVGTTRQVAFDDELVTATAALLESGMPVGELVTVLNEQQARRGAVPCVAVLGDPDAAFALPESEPEWQAGDVVAWPVPPLAVRRPAGAAYLLHERARTRVVTRGPAPGDGAGGADGSAGLPADASAALDLAVTVLRDARARVADGEALERVARSYARGLGALDDTLVALLDRCAATRQAVSNEVWGALGVCVADTRHRTTWHHQLDYERVRHHVRSWSDAVANLVAGWFVHEEVGGRYVADHFLPSLGAFRDTGPAYVLDERCPSCGGRLVAHDHEAPDLGLSRRTAVMCAACGPTATYGRLRADLRVGGDAVPGGTVRFTVSVEHPFPRHGSATDVVLQVKPRSSANPPVTLRRTAPPGTERVELDLRLPDDATCDVWSARCGVTSDGEVAFARRTFAPIAFE